MHGKTSHEEVHDIQNALSFLTNVGCYSRLEIVNHTIALTLSPNQTCSLPAGIGQLLGVAVGAL